jgi:CheY-like chemotaxis protein
MTAPTVLLVEDDSLMADLYGSILTINKFKVENITSGKIVHETAKELQPVIIILDLMMPDMNGLEVLDALKADENTKHIPTIMFSNYIDSDIMQQALDKGADRYAVKSEFKPHAFLELVKEVLGDSTAVVEGPK